MLFAAMTKNIEDYRVSIKGIEIEREALLKDVRSLEIEFSQWTAKCTAMKDKQAGETARRGKLVDELKIQVNHMLEARNAIEKSEEEQKQLAEELLQAEENVRLTEIPFRKAS